MDDWVNTRQAALLLGVGTTTIKRWADQGLIIHSKTAGGHRRFRKRDVRSFLATTQRRDPETPTSPPMTQVCQDWLELLCNSGDVESSTAALLDARSRLGAWHLVANECGMVMTTLGALWAEGQINIYQEQNASLGLRRGLASCCRIFPTPSRDQPTCLALPAVGDNHMGGVQLVELVAREAGWNVVAAAGPMPLEEVAIWAESLHRLDVIAVSASSFSDDDADLALQAQELRSLADRMGATLVLGGGGAWPSGANYENRVRDFTEFTRILRRIGGEV